MPGCRIACECCSLDYYWAGWCPTRKPARIAQSLTLQSEAFPVRPGSRRWGKAHHTPATPTQMEETTSPPLKKDIPDTQPSTVLPTAPSDMKQDSAVTSIKSATVVSKQSITRKNKCCSSHSNSSSVTREPSARTRTMNQALASTTPLITMRKITPVTCKKENSR